MPCAREIPLPANEQTNRPAQCRRNQQGLHDGICDYADFGTQSLAPDSRSLGEEGYPSIIRDVAQADPLQPCCRPHAVCARAFARVPAHRRQIRRSDPGSHRPSIARVRRCVLCHRRGRSLDSPAAQGRWIWPGAIACTHGAARGRIPHPRAGAVRLVDRGAAQLALHLRRLRHRQRQPVCACRGIGSGRAPFARLQSAVSVWRRGHGQDAPDARHRPRSKAAAAELEHLLRVSGEIHQRDDQLHPQRSHDQLSRSFPHGRRAADRRHSVHLAERAHAGGVLPHLQRAAREHEADRDRLRPPAQGTDGDRRPAALALRVGTDRRHSAARS